MEWTPLLPFIDTVDWATGRTFSLLKNWVLVCWWWWFDWSFARPIAPVVTTSVILSSNNGEILVSANQVHLENSR